MSLPGIPGIVVGHNKNIAWGMTTGWQDAQDLYVEKPNPANAREFEFRGAWEKAEVVREVILVKGRSAPLVEEVMITRHGPIVSKLVGEEKPLALRWTAHDVTDPVRAFLAINRAQSWDEFRTALGDWVTPPHNFVYADTAGNIGLVQAGAVCLREGGELLTAVDNPKDTWLQGVVQAVLPNLAREADKRVVALRATKLRPPKKLKDYRCQLAFRHQGRLLQVVTRPGVFSHREVDPGARALLDVVAVAPGDAALDVGCGSGAVAFGVAASVPGGGQEVLEYPEFGLHLEELRVPAVFPVVVLEFLESAVLEPLDHVLQALFICGIQVRRGPGLRVEDQAVTRCPGLNRGTCCFGTRVGLHCWSILRGSLIRSNSQLRPPLVSGPR